MPRVRELGDGGESSERALGWTGGGHQTESRLGSGIQAPWCVRTSVGEKKVKNSITCEADTNSC
jgi:hypothetical protein